MLTCQKAVVACSSPLETKAIRPNPWAGRAASKNLNQLMLWGITPAHLDNQPTCWDPFAVVPFSPGFGPRAQCVTPWLLRQDMPFPLLLSKVQISPIGIAALEHHSLLKAVVTGPQ